MYLFFGPSRNKDVKIQRNKSQFPNLVSYLHFFCWFCCCESFTVSSSRFFQAKVWRPNLKLVKPKWIRKLQALFFETHLRYGGGFVVGSLDTFPATSANFPPFLSISFHFMPFPIYHVPNVHLRTEFKHIEVDVDIISSLSVGILIILTKKNLQFVNIFHAAEVKTSTASPPLAIKSIRNGIETVILNHPNCCFIGFYLSNTFFCYISKIRYHAISLPPSWPVPLCIANFFFAAFGGCCT